LRAGCTNNTQRFARNAAPNNPSSTLCCSHCAQVWYNWLHDIHDWCISRQLWWGHRIPVYYVDGSSDYVVARSLEEAVDRAVEKGYSKDVRLEQDEDVLDTWFSSGLWPFATLGWGAQGQTQQQLTGKRSKAGFMHARRKTFAEF